METWETASHFKLGQPQKRCVAFEIYIYRRYLGFKIEEAHQTANAKETH
jgi:hypothetical protein